MYYVSQAAGYLIWPVTYFFSNPSESHQSILQNKLSSLNAKIKSPSFTSLTKRITFAEFYAALALAPKKVDGLISDLGLRFILKEMTNDKNSLPERLQNLALTLLCEQPLSLLEVVPFDYSEGWFILASDQQIVETPLKKLKGTPLEKRILCQRMQEIFKSTAGRLLLEQESSKTIDANISLGKLRMSKGEEISFHTNLDLKINLIPAKSMSYIAEEEIPSLDFSKCAVIGVGNCIKREDGENGIKRRLALLQPSQYEVIFKQFLLSRELLSFVPTAAFKQIKLSLLSQAEIHFLFSGDVEEKRKQFHEINPKEVADSFSMLSYGLAKLLSLDHIKALQIEKLTNDQFYDAFCSDTEVNNKQKIALLTSKQINDRVDRLQPHAMLFLSDAQINELDLTKLSKEQLEVLFSRKN